VLDTPGCVLHTHEFSLDTLDEVLDTLDWVLYTLARVKGIGEIDSAREGKLHQLDHHLNSIAVSRRR